MYLFFDTETTGLPRNWKAPVTDIGNWPRMVQVAWILTDEHGKHIQIKEFLIKPEGFSIPKQSTNIHGITTETALKKGHNLINILTEFSELVKHSKYVVAHNIAFDEKVIGAEFLRKSVHHDLDKKIKICTMKSSVNICKIQTRYGYKWPTLSELHTKLFGQVFVGAHDAATDIKATEKCFWQMKKFGYI